MVKRSVPGGKSYCVREVELGRVFVLFHLPNNFCYSCKSDLLLAVCLKIPPAENLKHKMHY